MQNDISASDYRQLLYEGSYNPLGLFYLTNKSLPNVLGIEDKINRPAVYTFLTDNYFLTNFKSKHADFQVLTYFKVPMFDAK